jgi:hypothetical protein
MLRCISNNPTRSDVRPLLAAMKAYTGVSKSASNPDHDPWIPYREQHLDAIKLLDRSGYLGSLTRWKFSSEGLLTYDSPWRIGGQ